MFQRFEQTSFGAMLLTKLNILLTDYISPPRLEKPPMRNVLVIIAHPIHDSLNGSLLMATKSGLQDAGHVVKVRRLYFDASCPEENYNGGTFPPLLQSHELNMYTSTMNNRTNSDGTNSGKPQLQPSITLATEVTEAVEDLQWCNSIVFIYPTWWGSFPAVLKGYFDRVLLPIAAFTVPHETVTPPILSHITRIAVVTTYHQSQWTTLLNGDSARTWISHTLRTFLSSDCTLTWRALYNVENGCDENCTSCKDDTEPVPGKGDLQTEIERTSEIFRHF